MVKYELKKVLGSSGGKIDALRLALVVGGLCMMIPGTLTDVIGLVVVGGAVLYQRMRSKRAAAAA